MAFNRKDLEDDNNKDDDFSFDDDFKFDDDNGTSAGDDFKFDDEPADIGLDDDDKGFGFEDEDMPALEESETGGEQRGASRTFVIIAALMIALFVIGLVAVLFIATQNTGPTPIELTATSISLTNDAIAQFLVQTQTAAPLIAQRQTEESVGTAQALTQTASAPTATLPPTETPVPSPTTEVTLDQTQIAANALATSAALATQVAAEQTLTAQAATPTPPQPSIDEVAQTATALAILLAPVPTQEQGLATQATGGPLPTALPDTGFFEDLAAGNGNVGLIALMALGLIGVIGVSRYLRTTNNRS